MNDRSNEALLARRALAEKATPGPWRYEKKCGSGPGVKTFLVLDPRDWPVGSAYDLTIVNEQNAAHIAANSPEVVMADIDEILRLRAEVERLNKEADWLAQMCAEHMLDGVDEGTIQWWRNRAREAADA